MYGIDTAGSAPRSPPRRPCSRFDEDTAGRCRLSKSPVRPSPVLTASRMSRCSSTLGRTLTIRSRRRHSDGPGSLARPRPMLGNLAGTCPGPLALSCPLFGASLLSADARLDVSTSALSSLRHTTSYVVPGALAVFFILDVVLQDSKTYSVVGNMTVFLARGRGPFDPGSMVSLSRYFTVPQSARPSPETM
jgi:hypothetical protein